MRLGKESKTAFDIMSDSEVCALETYIKKIADNIEKVEINYPNIKITKREVIKTPEGEAYVKLHEEAFKTIMDTLNVIMEAKRIAYIAELGKERDEE